MTVLPSPVAIWQRYAPGGWASMAAMQSCWYGLNCIVPPILWDSGTVCESYHHAVTLAALGFANFVGLWDKFSCFYVARKNLFSLVLFYFSLYRCVCRVPQSHSAPKNLCNHCGSRRCGRGTLVPQLSLTSHSHSGNSSYCCVSRSSLGNIIQTHSVRTPLIRFPRVLFRPLVSMRPSCLR